jgi:hypothetical protein
MLPVCCGELPRKLRSLSTCCTGLHASDRNEDLAAAAVVAAIAVATTSQAAATFCAVAASVAIAVTTVRTFLLCL